MPSVIFLQDGQRITHIIYLQNIDGHSDNPQTLETVSKAILVMDVINAALTSVINPADTFQAGITAFNARHRLSFILTTTTVIAFHVHNASWLRF